MNQFVVRLAAALLSTLRPGPAAAQLLLHRAPELSRAAIVGHLARLDSAATRPTTRMLVGVTLGTTGGAALGFGLACLGHQASCEGTVQCAARPDRALRTSTLAGAVAGGAIGAAIAWKTRHARDSTPSTGQSNER